MKVVTVIGTRPEIIRLSRIIARLDKFTKHVIVHTGQNYDYELNKIFFEDLEIRKPDYFLEASGNSTAETISNIIYRIDTVLEKEEPDAFLVLGDTNSCLAVISAKKRKIPIFHIEAGNRCYDQRVPEENNRKIVDHLSDINMTYSSIAREYLLREGYPPDQIIKVGSPLLEVLNYYHTKISNSDVLESHKLKPRKYLIFSSHREENVDDEKRLRKIADILNQLINRYKFPILFSVHPRTKNRIEKYDIKLDNKIIITKPLAYSDYIKLQENAACVISDSGTITEEASLLNFPAINLREAHERPEGMEEGTTIMTGLHLERIMEAFSILIEQRKLKSSTITTVPDYNVNNVSEKVLRIIISYVDYINRRVWYKHDD